MPFETLFERKAWRNCAKVRIRKIIQNVFEMVHPPCTYTQTNQNKNMIGRNDNSHFRTTGWCHWKYWKEKRSQIINVTFANLQVLSNLQFEIQNFQNYETSYFCTLMNCFESPCTNQSQMLFGGTIGK